MKRVTLKQLHSVVDRINRMTNIPSSYSEKRVDGSFYSNVGNFHLDGAYGGYALFRVCNESGGVNDVLRCGHVSKRELLSLMFAFIEGLSVERANHENA